MTLKRILAAAASAGALVFAPLAPALAQDGDAMPDTAPQTGEQAAPGPAVEVSDATLDSFVTAALEVSQVAQSYQSQMQAAVDDAARQTLATEAREAMISAVEETDGITVDEYVQISEAAQTDEQLNQRVMDLLAERAEAE